MPDLTNFFDDQFEKKFSVAVPPITLITACPHASLWLDPYGTWRCEICFPPLFETEVRERKNSQEVPALVAGVGKEGAGESKANDDGKSLSNVFTRIPGFDEFESWGELPSDPPCPKCSSLDFWWDVLGHRHCQRCLPRPKRSRELLDLAPKLRAAAEASRLAELKKQSGLAKTNLHVKE